MIITDPKQSATTKISVLGELIEAGATNGKIDTIFFLPEFFYSESLESFLVFLRLLIN